MNWSRHQGGRRHFIEDLPDFWPPPSPGSQISKLGQEKHTLQTSELKKTHMGSCLLWRNVCLGLFSTFWLGCLFFCYWVVWAACIFLKLILCSVVLFGIIFSHSEGCLFILLIVSFAVQKLLSLIRTHLFTFVFISVTLGGGSQKILLWFMSSSVLPVFSSRGFIVSGLTFRSLIQFEFIFVYSVRKCYNFILLHVAVQFSQDHLLKRLSLPHCIFLPSLSKIRYP